MKQAAKKTMALILSAQNKRDDALSRTHQALATLDPQKQKITFTAVAKLAQVSRAWLYREPTICQQIEKLRQSAVHDEMGFKNRNLQTIQALKNKIKKLEEKNKALENQLEIVYGKLYSQSEKILK